MYTHPASEERQTSDVDFKESLQFASNKWNGSRRNGNSFYNKTNFKSVLEYI